MATKVEIERAKIKQMTRIETKLMRLEDSVERLSEIIDQLLNSKVEENVTKLKKVKSEK